MEKDNNNIKPVSIRYNEEGQPDGVRIRTIDEDFTIALHDACNHDVAPHAGAWIETSSSTMLTSAGPVAPHAGAWIETGRYARRR